MTFFQGASNVKINGGDFTVVNGSYTVFDQSRHTSNVNSFNTTNNTTLDSFNDNSQRYYNQRPQQPPPPTFQGRRSSNGPSASEAQYANGSYFPPPSIHPALGSAHNLPPGSTVNNNDSFNMENNTVDNSYNDNSRGYNVPLSERSQRRNPNVGPQANPRHPSYGSGMQANQRLGNGQIMSANTNVRPQYGRASTSSSSSANFSPGQVSSMTTTMQQAMSTLMQEVVKQTAPDPVAGNDRNQGHEEEDSDDSSGSEEEEVRRLKHRPINSVNIQHGMAQLSLGDASTQPTFSRTKSAPPDPIYESTPNTTNGFMNSSIPEYANSNPSLSQGTADGFIMDQPQPYQSPPLQPSSSNSAMNVFGSATITSPNGPVFNTVNGPYTKYDSSHHISNIGSGNTYNSLIKDSYNDQSLQVSAPPRNESKLRRLGQKFSRK